MTRPARRLLLLAAILAACTESPSGVIRPGETGAVALVFAVQPHDGWSLAGADTMLCGAGGCFVHVVVRAVDSAGAVDAAWHDSIRLILDTNGAAAAWSHTLAAVAGEIRDSLQPPRGAGYTLVAAAPSLRSASSASFVMRGDTGVVLRIDPVPAGTVDSGSAFSLAVSARDHHGALAREVDGSAVTLRVDSGPAGAALGGTLTGTMHGGVAAFPGLRLDVLGGYRIVASHATVPLGAPLAVSAIRPLGPAVALVFAGQPNDAFKPSIMASAFCLVRRCNSAFEVRAVDAAGRVDTTYTGSIAVTLAPHPSGAAWSVTKPAVRGVLRDSIYGLVRATGYVLGAASAGLSGAQSSAFMFYGEPPARLALFAPAPLPVAGATFSLRVELRDVDGGFAGEISGPAVTLSSDSGPSGGVLSGVLQQTVQAGAAVFGGLSASVPGTYRVRAASGSLTEDALPLRVTPVSGGTATRLLFVTQPNAATHADTTSGCAVPACAIGFTVRAVDGAGAVDTTFTDTIAVTVFGFGNGVQHALRKAAVRGALRDSISSWRVPRLAQYNLRAAGAWFQDTWSSAFAVSGPAPYGLNVRTFGSANRNQSFAVYVDLIAADGVAGEISNVQVGLAIDSGPAGAVLGNAFPRTTQNGTASFAVTTLDLPGDYILTASSPPLVVLQKARVHVY